MSWSQQKQQFQPLRKRQCIFQAPTARKTLFMLKILPLNIHLLLWYSTHSVEHALQGTQYPLHHLILHSITKNSCAHNPAQETNRTKQPPSNLKKTNYFSLNRSISKFLIQLCCRASGCQPRSCKEYENTYNSWLLPHTRIQPCNSCESIRNM